MRRAFLFPGQGSQSLGMARPLIETEVGRRTFAEASNILGYDLAVLCNDGPKERLDTTLYTQPALYTASCALVDLAREHGIDAELVAGHSVGEYAALYAAGVVSFSDGARIIAERARLMHGAGGGKMIAVIGMAPEVIEEALAGVSGAGVGLYNSPGQIVVSGSSDGVDAAEKALREAGGKKIVPLAVSGAFHSEQMRPVRDDFAAALAQYAFHAPKVTFVSNVSGGALQDPNEIRAALADLLVSPVRWMQAVGAIAERGIKQCVELGPGKVLQGLVRQTDKSLPCKSAASPQDLVDLAQSPA